MYTPCPAVTPVEKQEHGLLVPDHLGGKKSISFLSCLSRCWCISSAHWDLLWSVFLFSPPWHPLCVLLHRIMIVTTLPCSSDIFLAGWRWETASERIQFYSVVFFLLLSTVGALPRLVPSSQAVFIFFSILYAQEIELWSRKWPFSLFSVVYIASSSASGDFF